MKRFLVCLGLLIIVLTLAIMEKKGMVDFKKIKNKILHVDNYLRIYNSYMGKEEIQEVSGIYFEKEKYNDGYLILNQNMITSLSNGTVVYKGVMDNRKTILVMSEYAIYKYQNIDEYACYLYQNVQIGDILGSNNGATYYEVEYEN